MVRYSQNDQFRQERKDFSMSFKEIKPEELNFNPFTRIGSDWMLLTAGTKDKFNTMTAAGAAQAYSGANRLLPAISVPSATPKNL